MPHEFFSAFQDWDHALKMLGVVRAAGVDAALLSRGDVPHGNVPDWAGDDGSVCFMMVPEGQRTRAEVATHKFYGLCRWCGHRLGGQVAGDCPECGTPIDPYAGVDPPASLSP